jgi:aspartyl-tRNA synthetase
VKPPLANRYRTAWAGQLRADSVGEELRVAGWVHRRRDHGGLIFVDLRDRSGLLQLVFRPDESPEPHAAARRLRSEDVLSASGKLARREEGTVNPSLPTGEVELNVAEFDLLSSAETPPFQVDEDEPVDELLRLRYRYLDLRKEPMRGVIELRHAVIRTMREHLSGEGFLEIETPILTRSTPEGARDYLVPSRLQRGSWYALPQSPQLFKQLLMIAGYERYFQIARCFRDEDFRADRQPEFTQLDMELSFVEEDDVIAVCDRLLQAVLAVGGIEIELPIERMSYDDVMLRYGSDRPDRRLGMEIHDLSYVFGSSEFNVFTGAIADGGVVRGFTAHGALPRRRFDELTEQAQELGAKGLVWAVRESDGWRSPIAKFLADDEMARAGDALGAREGDSILIVADQAEVAARVLGELRIVLAGEADPERGHMPAAQAARAAAHDLFWVVDFPMFGWNEQEARWDALHHPFTSPKGDLNADPGTWRSRAYDVVMDGLEIGGGSIRISRPDLQQRVFETLGIPADEARERFGFLLEALRYGAPPHGGIAFGLDRIVALLAGRDSIREVIPFPKTASGSDPLTGAPSPVDPRQLRELGVRPEPAAPTGEQAPEGHP